MASARSISDGAKSQAGGCRKRAVPCKRLISQMPCRLIRLGSSVGARARLRGIRTTVLDEAEWRRFRVRSDFAAALSDQFKAARGAVSQEALAARACVQAKVIQRIEQKRPHEISLRALERCVRATGVEPAVLFDRVFQAIFPLSTVPDHGRHDQSTL